MVAVSNTFNPLALHMAKQALEFETIIVYTSHLLHQEKIKISPASPPFPLSPSSILTKQQHAIVHGLVASLPPLKPNHYFEGKLADEHTLFGSCYFLWHEFPNNLLLQHTVLRIPSQLFMISILFVALICMRDNCNCNWAERGKLHHSGRVADAARGEAECCIRQ